MNPTHDFTVIGGGPAGLTAAYDLAFRGVPVLVLEQDGQWGGLSKTVVHNGYRFDIGGHRFFTKNEQIKSIWQEVLGEDFLRRPRLSRILYDGKLFAYPMQIGNVLKNLGILPSVGIMASFIRRQLFPHRPEKSFEDWVSNRFGVKLYEAFFKTYSEKVWGIPCTELSADWAAQRIRNLNLWRTAAHALGLGGKKDVASLIDEFDYPALGPGQMYEAMAGKAQARGAQVRLRSQVVRLRHDGRRITQLLVSDAQARMTEVSARSVISTMPIDELVARLEPVPPREVVQAAQSLRYRSILTVNLIIRKPDLLPDTWVYLHSPQIQAGRLQLFRNWSPAMVPDPAMSSIALEYFCWQGDSFWNLSSEQLVAIANQDLKAMGLADPALVEDGFPIRYAKAYPVYDDGYMARLAMVREFLSQFDNLACAGRYGQFRYNNMDHSMLTALLAVQRLLGQDVDPWSVNAEAEYHEEKKN